MLKISRLTQVVKAVLGEVKIIGTPLDFHELGSVDTIAAIL